MATKPRILVLDIENSPAEFYGWSPWNQNHSYNQLKKDRHLMSCAAMWYGEKKVLYMDQRKEKDVSNDKKLCIWIHALIGQADIIMTKNGKRHDEPILKARFLKNKLKPVKPTKHIDTESMARKFGLLYYGLEYLADFLGVKFKKMKSKKFIGQDLWTECLKGNKAAWIEMERYNKHDVLATRDVFEAIKAWGIPGINLAVYTDLSSLQCSVCGSTKLKKEGFDYTEAGKFQRYSCLRCGKWSSLKGEANNLLSKEKRASLKLK